MPAERTLIVNADDYGLTPGVSDGILRAGADGVVTSASFLVLGPAASTWAPALRDSGLGVGCHLALVGEDALVLSAAEVPTLVDRRGRPLRSWREFVTRAARGAVNPDEVRREFAAQIDACRALGLDLDHLDTHQHLHLWPSVAAVVVDLAAGDRLALRCPTSAAVGPRGLGVRRLSAALAERCRAAAVPTTTTFAGLDGAGHMGEQGMVRAVRAMAANHSAELGVHPGLPGDPQRARYPWNYDWAGELSALRSHALRAAVDEAGFALGTFADLMPS